VTTDLRLSLWDEGLSSPPPKTITNSIAAFENLNHSRTTSTTSIVKVPANMAAAAANIPDFVKKLYRMLEDKSYSNIVSWGISGDTFVVHDTTEFAKSILPRHFKHNNFASFVRQLNKYDFHKIKTNDDGSRREQAWEFQHPKFQCNRRDLLEEIKRKTPQKPIKPVSNADGSTAQIHVGKRQDIYSEVDSLVELQTEMSNCLESLNKNYHTVMDEILVFRRTLAAQDDLMQNLVQFLTQHKNSENFSRISSFYPPRPTLTSSNSPSISASSVPETVLLTDNNESQPIMSSSTSEVNRSNFTNVPGNFLSQSLVNDQNSSSTVVSPPLHHQYSSTSSLGFNPSSVSASDNNLTLFTLNQLSLSPSTSARQFSSATSNPENTNSTSISYGRKTTITSSSSQLQSDNNTNNHQIYMNQGSSSVNFDRDHSWLIPPRILVVEDESSNRNFMTNLLHLIGCHYDIAIDGVTAINKINETKYDLIFMDLMMPNLDVLNALQQIRSIDNKTPIVSVTENPSENAFLENDLPYGINGSLEKPYSREGIYAIIDKFCIHLKGPSLERNQSMNARIDGQMIVHPHLNVSNDPSNTGTFSENISGKIEDNNIGNYAVDNLHIGRNDEDDNDDDNNPTESMDDDFSSSSSPRNFLLRMTSGTSASSSLMSPNNNTLYSNFGPVNHQDHDSLAIDRIHALQDEAERRNLKKARII
ncbi:13545_t:CDS:2, partial [Ambispora leptoticha]